MQRLLIILILTPLALGAQTPASYQAGSRSAALSHASTALDGAGAIFHNPAITAFWEDKKLLLSYQNRFFLPDLRVAHGGIAIPTPLGTLGGSLATEGSRLASNGMASVFYSRGFGKYFSAALQVNYQVSGVQESRVFQTATFHAALYSKLGDKLRLGFLLYNPSTSYLDRATGQRLPAVGSLGMSFVLNENSRLLANVRAHSENAWRYALGYELTLLDALYLRAGAALAQRSSISAGLGLDWKNLQFNLAYQYQQVLRSNLVYGLQWRWP